MLDFGREWKRIFAPATIANVGPGFDVLGLAVRNIEDVDRDGVTLLGDVLHVRETAGRSTRISEIYVNGAADYSLPIEVEENVVGVAALAVSTLADCAPLDMRLEKMPFFGSGMGSSAASVVAGAYAALLMSGDDDKSRIADTVVKCEVGQHPDNVLPSLLGGMVISYGLTDDKAAFGTLYDQDIIALKYASSALRHSDKGLDELIGQIGEEGCTDITSVLSGFEEERATIADKTTRHLNYMAEQHSIQYYNLLIHYLEKRAELLRNLRYQDGGEAARQIADRISSTVAGLSLGEDLTSILDRLGELGIAEIEPDLARIRTYESRRMRRVENIPKIVEDLQKSELIKLLGKSLSQKLKQYCRADISLKYRRLNIPSEVLDNLYFVLVKPDVTISTVEARARMNQNPDLPDAVANFRSLSNLFTSLYEKDIKSFGEATCQDRIAEVARGPLIPGYYSVKEAALQNGAYGFNISGSGPTCFAVCDSQDVARRVARACMSKFSDAGVESNGYICKVDLEGARLIKHV